jgi:hypothetical protein
MLTFSKQPARRQNATNTNIYETITHKIFILTQSDSSVSFIEMSIAKNQYGHLRC